ncbi:alpha/beta hydrolase [Pseudomonas sp. NY15181]|uniref:alpha/beta hydrolase n=1 Tax=Pseudomonas sp. NY15181 TaxID=3400349 RepID=UPI003A85A471
MTTHATPTVQAPRPSGKGLPVTWRAAAPDRDARAFLRMLNLATQLKPIEAYSLGEIRELWRLTALALGTRPPLASVRQFEIDGPGGELSLRIYSPSRGDALLPAFIWVHGGGFMVGGLDSAESICRNIARTAGCITVAISYRLAPEHDLNASREDCLAALNWIVEHAQELGIDAERLAIGGDSAGGNLTAVIAQEARSQGLKLALQVLAYPATELLESFPSLTENADGYMVTQHMLGHIQRTIAHSVAHLDLSSPLLSPRRQRNLRGVAPALIISAGLDPIRDDGLDYAARLRNARIPVLLLHYPGQFHGFLNFDAINGAASDALLRISAALTEAFEGQHADTTLEIADTAPDREVGGELRSTAVTLWNATDGWRDALLTRLAPRLARTTRWALLPYSTTTHLLRRCLQGRDPRTALQTYPPSS